MPWLFRQDAAATARPALPSQEEVHSHKLVRHVGETLIVLESLLIHIHINMFDAFVKKLIILYCSCGMSLILHIHTNLFQTFAIPTRRCTFHLVAKTPWSHKQRATWKYKSKCEITGIIVLVRFILRLPQSLHSKTGQPGKTENMWRSPPS